MEKQELVDKLVSWCIAYAEENGHLPLREVLQEVMLDVSYLSIAMNDGSITGAAAMLHESRTTLSMRTNAHPRNNLELSELSDKHNVKFVPRQRNKNRP